MRMYRLHSPYFALGDTDSVLDDAALLAGQVRTTAEELRDLIASIGRLTSITTPQQEVRAQQLLETLCTTKRQFAAVETKRFIQRSYDDTH